MTAEVATATVRSAGRSRVYACRCTGSPVAARVGTPATKRQPTTGGGTTTATAERTCDSAVVARCTRAAIPTMGRQPTASCPREESASSRVRPAPSTDVTSQRSVKLAVNWSVKVVATAAPANASGGDGCGGTPEGASTKVAEPATATSSASLERGGTKPLKMALSRNFRHSTSSSSFCRAARCAAAFTTPADARSTGARGGDAAGSSSLVAAAVEFDGVAAAAAVA